MLNFGYTQALQQKNGSRLIYLHARWYDPKIRRFISEDSFNLINRYSYVEGNPVNKADPSGHISTGLGIGIGAATALVGAGAEASLALGAVGLSYLNNTFPSVKTDNLVRQAEKNDGSLALPSELDMAKEDIKGRGFVGAFKQDIIYRQFLSGLAYGLTFNGIQIATSPKKMLKPNAIAMMLLSDIGSGFASIGVADIHPIALSVADNGSEGAAMSLANGSKPSPNAMATQFAFGAASGAVGGVFVKEWSQWDSKASGYLAKTFGFWGVRGATMEGVRNGLNYGATTIADHSKGFDAATGYIPRQNLYSLMQNVAIGTTFTAFEGAVFGYGFGIKGYNILKTPGANAAIVNGGGGLFQFGIPQAEKIFGGN